jgi:hypothetical protein
MLFVPKWTLGYSMMAICGYGNSLRFLGLVLLASPYSMFKLSKNAPK